MEAIVRTVLVLGCAHPSPETLVNYSQPLWGTEMRAAAGEAGAWSVIERLQKQFTANRLSQQGPSAMAVALIGTLPLGCPIRWNWGN